MIEIEVAPVTATLLGFKQFSESHVSAAGLEANVKRLAKLHPQRARELRDALLAPLGLRLSGV